MFIQPHRLSAHAHTTLPCNLGAPAFLTSCVLLQRALFLHANDIKPALEWLTERYGALQSGGGSFDLSSSLHLGQAGAANGRSAPRGFEFGRDASSTGAREY